MRLLPAPRRNAGFTLVEVLVALLALAILAGLSWQALDGILRARDGTREALDRTVRLATVLTQWEQDLQAIHDSQIVPALAFDGQTLRLTRRTEGGVSLIAWAVRGGVWQRWAGPVQTRRSDLREIWLSSFQFMGNEPGQLVVAESASEWQIYFHRGGAWTNAQSSGDLVLAPAPIVVAAPTVSQAAVPAPAAPAVNAPEGGGQEEDGQEGDGQDGDNPQGGSEPDDSPTAPVVAREALPDAVRLVITLDGRTLTRDIELGPGGGS